MILKPKATTLEQRGLLFRRYTDIKISNGVSAIYAPIPAETEPRYMFDATTAEFIDVTENTTASATDIKTSTLKWQNYFYTYDTLYKGWKRTTKEDDPSKFLPVKSATIGRYQTNAYCLDRSFQFTIKGSIAGGTTQFVKGNIVGLETMTIKYYDDTIRLCPDDLVVINGRLYAVEDPVMDRKMNPRPFNIYTATLNSIN